MWRKGSGRCITVKSDIKETNKHLLKCRIIITSLRLSLDCTELLEYRLKCAAICTLTCLRIYLIIIDTI